MTLPLLPLEVFQPQWCDGAPHAVLEQERVLLMNRAAALLGVRDGLRRGGVQALAPDVVLHERDKGREQQALQAVACCMLQYTPEVAFTGPAQLVMDVTASLRAFGGRLALCRRVRASLRLLGFTARIGMGPTALGARLLADAPPPGAGHVRGGQVSSRRRVLRLERLTAVLDTLPVDLLAAARAHHDWLDGIGCRTLGELRRLPRAGLQRRSSKLLLDELDRAYGQSPELHDWVAVPPVFAAYVELPYRTEQSDAILLSANGLLLQMTGWLVVQQLALTRLQLSMEHERGRTAIPPSLLEITLAQPAWQEAHLLRLLKERLERMQLVGPVIALRLQALELAPLVPPTASLFPEPGGTPADYQRLLELLVARLGDDAVLTPAPLADHRPEVCNRWQPAMRALGQRDHHAAGLNAAKPDRWPQAERPFWLLAQPLALLVREHRPFYGSPLQLVSAPERIESGWWDGNFVARDYFIAIGAESACYWVYRERRDDEVRWFLHGLFA